jgi:ribosomal protein S18 acetylase RimI-like enzyme
MQIRAAHPSEAGQLAELAWLAKSSWGYSPAQLAAWREDLTPTAESITARPTFVAEANGRLVGFSQLNLMANPIELEHLWVHPAFMRQGVGRLLLSNCLELLASSAVESLHVDSDPNAEVFYVACGAVRVGEVAAPIEGQPERLRPQLRIATRSLTPPSSGQPQATLESAAAAHVER